LTRAPASSSSAIASRWPRRPPAQQRRAVAVAVVEIDAVDRHQLEQPQLPLGRGGLEPGQEAQRVGERATARRGVLAQGLAHHLSIRSCILLRAACSRF